jgi:hypothetical protein
MGRLGVFFYRPSSLVGARLNKHARSLCPLDESILLSLVKQHVRLIYYSADNWHKKQRLVDTDPGNFTRSYFFQPQCHGMVRMFRK